MSAEQTDSQRQEHFTALIEQHLGIVFKVTLTYCWHPDDRAELQQEVIAQLWRAFPGFDPEQAFSTWMYRIALNVSISYVRKNQRHKQRIVPYDEQKDSRADPHGEVSDDPRWEVLQQFIEELDPLNRAVMLLYLEEHSYRHIADIIGISETNVASKISRLKKRVKKLSSRSELQGEHRGNE